MRTCCCRRRATRLSPPWWSTIPPSSASGWTRSTPRSTRRCPPATPPASAAGSFASKPSPPGFPRTNCTRRSAACSARWCWPPRNQTSSLAPPPSMRCCSLRSARRRWPPTPNAPTPCRLSSSPSRQGWRAKRRTWWPRRCSRSPGCCTSTAPRPQSRRPASGSSRRCCRCCATASRKWSALQSSCSRCSWPRCPGRRWSRCYHGWCRHCSPGAPTSTPTSSTRCAT
mmetsp:Transcript_6583/g.21597  ORF Transcript_6583/g.21597 Transcript_6583/m.21597 type:complete len:227 (+) Transcript_6583:827-1507(+)